MLKVCWRLDALLVVRLDDPYKHGASHEQVGRQGKEGQGRSVDPLDEG